MEFLLTVILIFVFFGWLLRKLFPLFLAWYVKRKMRKCRQQEGKVTVETVQEQEKVIAKDMGEYVDFEEEKL